MMAGPTSDSSQSGCIGFHKRDIIILITPHILPKAVQITEERLSLYSLYGATHSEHSNEKVSYYRNQVAPICYYFKTRCLRVSFLK